MTTLVQRPNMANYLLNLPYADRQYIGFVSSYEEMDRSNQDMYDWLFKYRGYKKLPYEQWEYKKSEVKEEYFLEVWQRRGVKQILLSDADKFRLPSGHPKHGVIYAAHPTLKGVYYPFELYHRFTFEHKFFEVVNLLMHLGATRIEVEHLHGYSQKFASSINASLLVKGVPGSISHESEGQRSSRSGILYHASFKGCNPSIPENLAWYDTEPAWQQIAEGRIKFGLKNFDLIFKYIDDHSINKKTKASIAGFGFSVSEQFEEHQDTTWKITGEFAEIKESEPENTTKKGGFLSFFQN